MDIYFVIGGLIGALAITAVIYLLYHLSSLLGGMLLLSLRGIYLFVTQPPQTNPKQGRLNHISSTDKK